MLSICCYPILLRSLQTVYEQLGHSCVANLLTSRQEQHHTHEQNTTPDMSQFTLTISHAHRQVACLIVCYCCRYCCSSRMHAFIVSTRHSLCPFLHIHPLVSVVLVAVKLPKQYQEGNHEPKLQLGYEFWIGGCNPHSYRLDHHAHKLKHLKLGQVPSPPEVLALLLCIFANNTGQEVVCIHDNMYKCIDEYAVPRCMTSTTHVRIYKWHRYI